MAADGLSKSFGSVRAVRNVSFDIAQGELVGFLGPNGAGKSTTMKMLTGSLLPDAGRATVDGVSLDGRGLGARAAVGYLPEQTPLYGEMRVRRYLSFVGEVHGMSRRARGDAIERVVDACDLDGYADRRIRTLSKGYRQRVGLAQALFADPPALVLDEPTSGLDPAEIVRIRDLVVRLSRSKTILLSTHVLPEVEEVCRRVMIIAGGELVVDGQLASLAESAGEAISITTIAPEAEVLALANQVARELGGSQGGAGLASVASRDVIAGRVRVTVSVGDRFAAAEQLAREVADRGWPLLELRHEVPTLERVFLERIRAHAARGAAPIDGPEGRKVEAS